MSRAQDVLCQPRPCDDHESGWWVAHKHFGGLTWQFNKASWLGPLGDAALFIAGVVLDSGAARFVSHRILLSLKDASSGAEGDIGRAPDAAAETFVIARSFDGRDMERAWDALCERLSDTSPWHAAALLRSLSAAFASDDIGKENALVPPAAGPPGEQPRAGSPLMLSRATGLAVRAAAATPFTSVKAKAAAATAMPRWRTPPPRMGGGLDSSAERSILLPSEVAL